MTLSRRDRALLSALALLVVVGGIWFFVVRPAGAEATVERERLAQVRSEVGGIRDTIARLSSDPVSESERTAERLRLAKALPAQRDTPGTVLQLQRLADRANVELTSVRVNGAEDHGGLASTEYEIRVTGRFFDADDFLYRLHRLTVVDDAGRPAVGGRLFATVGIDVNLAEQATADDLGGTLSDTDPVVVTARVRTFSSSEATAPASDVAVTP